MRASLSKLCRRRALTKETRKCAMFCLPAGNTLSFVCHSHFAPIYQMEKGAAENDIPQNSRVNVLLKQNENGVFEDKVQQFGLSESGWTWNAKFADLDNDGWQDCSSSTAGSGECEPNRISFIAASKAKPLKDITEKSGLASNLSTLSYTYLDIDNDGDLDIIAVPTVGTLEVYINQSPPKQSIAFELNDNQRQFLRHRQQNHYQLRRRQTSDARNSGERRLFIVRRARRVFRFGRRTIHKKRRNRMVNRREKHHRKRT